MRVLVLLGLLALCASALAIQDNAALQPNFPLNEDDDSFLEALSANMNINEDLDSEINALDDVKSADELKEKATEIADKLAEMKARLDEEESRVHKRRRREDPKEDKVREAEKEVISKGCGWEDCGKFKKRVFTKPADAKPADAKPADPNAKPADPNAKPADAKAPNPAFANRIIVATAEGQWVRAFHGEDAAKVAEKATKWCTAPENAAIAAPPNGWTAKGAAWIKGNVVRKGFDDFAAVKTDKPDDVVKKINELFTNWKKDDCTKTTDSIGDAHEQQQQQKKEQPKKEQVGQPKKEQGQPGQPQQQQGNPPPGQTPENAPKPPSQFDDAVEEEDTPQQQQQGNPQPAPAPQQQEKPQQATTQQTQPQQQPAQGSDKKGHWHADNKPDQPQKENNKKEQHSKKDNAKKDTVKKDKKDQTKKDQPLPTDQAHKQEQQDKAAVAARVAKLKGHGFEEVTIDGQTFLVGEVKYQTVKKVQKTKTVITNASGNYLKEISGEHESEDVAKKLKGKTAKLSFPPKNYNAADSNKFLVRATDDKTYVRANFYPFGLRHCQAGSKLETCIAKKKVALQKQADEADKTEAHADAETEANPEAETQPDTVEAEVVNDDDNEDM